MKKTFTKVGRSRNGKLSSDILLDMEQEGGWSGYYRISTHGKSPEETAAEIEGVRQHHLKKAARLTGFQSVWNTEFVVAGVTYRIMDCTLWERGTDVELYASVRPSTGEKFPSMSWVFGSMSAVPDDAAIVAMIREVVQKSADENAAHEAYQARVEKLVGGGGV